MSSYGKAFPLWLLFLTAFHIPTNDPYFCSDAHRRPGVLAQQLALFALWAKDYTHKENVKLLMQDLRNDFEAHFAPIDAFGHHMVLHARKDNTTSIRDASLAHEERAILAVSPALFDHFWNIYWRTPYSSKPLSRENRISMMIALAGGTSLAHTLRISELSKTPARNCINP